MSKLGIVGAIRSGGLEFRGIGVGRSVEFESVIGRREGVHAVRVERDVREQRLARLGLIALGVAIRQPALVAPPEVDLGPVDAVPVRSKR